MHIVMIGPRRVLPHPEAGLDRYVWELSSYLASQGHSVTIYCHRGERKTEAPLGGILVKKVWAPRLHHWDTFAYSFLATCHALLEKADLLHYHGGSALFAWVARLLGRKVAVTIHSREWGQAPVARWWAPFYFFGEWVACKAAHDLSAVSKELAGDLEKRLHKKVCPLAAGISAPPTTPQEVLLPLGLQPKRYLLFLGRLERGKGLELLMEAFSSLTGIVSHPLVIAGEPLYDRAYLENLKRRAPPNVLFAGRVDGALKAALLTHALLYIQASEREGISLSLLEALAHGLPVLVSDIGQNREAAESCGRFFRGGDVCSLKENLLQLLQNPLALKAAGEQGRQLFSAKYSWQSRGGAFLEFYRRTQEPLGRSG